MEDNKEKKIEKTVQILKQLDETSLLLVMSSASVLAARQKIAETKEVLKI